MYCQDCEVAACSRCLSVNHKCHHLANLKAYVQQSITQYHTILEETDALMSAIDETMVHTKRHIQQASADIEETKRNIDKAIDERINKVNEKRSELLTQLDQIQCQKNEAVMTLVSNQEMIRENVMKLRSDTYNMLHQAADCKVLQQLKDFKSRMVSSKTLRLPTFAWFYNNTDVPSSDNCQTDSGETHNDLMVVDMSVKTDTIDSGPHKVIPLVEERMLMTGLVVMSQSVWVLYTGQSTLYVYPLAPPHKHQSLPLMSLKGPTDMARFPPGKQQLFISDYTNKRLSWIKLEQIDDVWEVADEMTMKVKYLPLGLAVHDNQLLVCGDDNVIHLLNTSGKETGRVRLPNTVKPSKAVGQPTTPGYVVTDCTHNQVVLVNKNGDVQHTYRGVQGFSPGDIVCQGQSIFVSDCENYSVDELNDEGHHVRQVISEEEASEPGILCVDESGRLFAEQNNHGKMDVWVIETTTPPDKLFTHKTRMEFNVTWCA